MTVQELIEALEGFDPEAEVRLASQPEWPMEYTLSDKVGETYDATEGRTIVFIAEGTQLGYLPDNVAEHVW